ncbi:MAG: hypothetical protein K9M54_01985 [Kiritimatiellales bacterium]|nr:hypothetical protein [Kiritimatiellales bacterium]MCF7864306.1 hypothetical protein [Kiritimatiellales bacterium]
MSRITLTIMSALFIAVTLPAAKETNDAKIYSKAKFIRCKEGVNIYGGDADKPCFKSIPKKFAGREITLRVIDSSDPLEFEVKEAGIVTLVVETVGARKLVKQGWVEVGKVVITGLNGAPRELPVVQKELSAGKFSIPSEGLSGSRLLK